MEGIRTSETLNLRISSKYIIAKLTITYDMKMMRKIAKFINDAFHSESVCFLWLPQVKKVNIMKCWLFLFSFFNKKI